MIRIVEAGFLIGEVVFLAACYVIGWILILTHRNNK